MTTWNWHQISETILQFAETGMLVMFVVEVFIRTLAMTIVAIRKAVQSMRKDTE